MWEKMRAERRFQPAPAGWNQPIPVSARSEDSPSQGRALGSQVVVPAAAPEGETLTGHLGPLAQTRKSASAGGERRLRWLRGSPPPAVNARSPHRLDKCCRHPQLDWMGLQAVPF